jgi:hypothetical protein
MLYDTIVIGAVRRAMQHHGGYVELGQFVAEVGEPGIDAGVAGVRRRARRDVEAALPRLLADARAPARTSTL